MEEYPTLEQIEMHFKDAKQVLSNYGSSILIREDLVIYYICDIFYTLHEGHEFILWDDIRGYAKII